MSELVFTRAGRAKPVQVSGDKFARMSGETYTTVAEVVALTGLTYKEVLARMVQHAADNIVIVDPYEER